ncbi:MAG: hypothetical protein JW846_06240 [Dehalococcoidia bacterium]|nr:hypothetical protein [Dehalococcoidia bacterium]
MESTVSVLFVLIAIAGVVALQVRQAKWTIVSMGVALGLFAVAMFVLGAVEVGIGAILAAVALLLVLRWGVAHTGPDDSVPAFAEGFGMVFAVVSLVAFTVVAIVIARGYLPVDSMAQLGGEEGSGVGLLREGLVIATALAAVWAMLRKRGRRDQ